MSGELRQSGIDVLGTVSWGTHFCQFYQTKEDLLDTLVPYFKAGLENNEFCMWITSEPLRAEEASNAMHRAMPDFDDRISKGQIEILPHTDWYLKGGSFDQQRVLNGWVEKLNRALTEGYAGLRLTGNTFWLEKRDWQSFTDYEAAVNNVIGKYRMLALCTYSLAKCGAAEVIDVIRNHEFALVRKEGKWELIENAIHKQAKQALLESERKYRYLLDTLQEGIWVIDNDMITTFVNPHLSKMLGYAPGEMLGKHLFSFIDEAKLSIARERIERRQKGIKEQVEFEFRCKDGNHVHTLISAAPVFDDHGDFSGVIAGVVDITERKQAEEAMRDAVLRYRTVADNTYDFEFWIDTEGQFLYASPSCQRIYGRKPEEFLSDPGLRRRLVHPDDMAAFDSHVADEANQVQGEVEFRIVHADGTNRCIAHVCQPVFDEHGRYLGVRGSNRDITERKQAEEVLRRIEWLLTRQATPQVQQDKRIKVSAQSYGDLTQLNRSRLILDSVGQDILAYIVGDYLDLLDTSAAVYEKNGDYALGIFTSSWCQFMDLASRNLCGTADNQEALGCGKWLCHESCWTKASEAAIESSQPMDIECEGGIHLYALPISAGGEIVGSINFGYGDPPRDSVKQKELAAKYHVSVEELDRKAKAYETRPYYIIELAKQRLQASARLIGEIIERKQAEESLRETRDYLENLLNYANAPIIVWDHELRITRFNRAFERLTGYNVKEVLGKKLDILFPAQTREESLKHIRRTASGERWEVIEIPILCTDGSERTVLWNSATLYAPDGKTVVATIAQGQDITERKQAEQEIKDLMTSVRQEKDKLSSLVNSIPDEVWFADTQQNFTLANPSALFEFNIGSINRNGLGIEALAKSLDVYRPDKTPRPFEEAPPLRALKGETIRNQEEIIRTPTSGELRWRWVSAAPVTDANGNIIGSVSVVHDITGLKKAEEELRETRDYLDNLLNYANAPIIVWDHEFRITRFNRAFERLTGYNASEVLGKNLDILFPAQTRRESMKHIRRTASGERWEVIEIPILRTDDSVRTVLWNSATLYSPDGKKVVATMAQGQDITERKQAEQELAKQAFMLANVSDAVMGMDIDYHINYWSPSAERMYGYSSAEAMGKATLDLIKPVYVGERREEVVQRLMSTGYVEAEYIHETKAGRRLNIEMRSTLMRNDRGEPFGIISVNRNITERRRAEEIQHIGDMGSWDWNVVTGELNWSDQIYTMFGLKPGQFAATYEAFLNYVHPDDRAGLELAVNEALYNAKQYNIEHRVVRSDGYIRMIHEKAKVYLNRKGKPVRMIGTVQDITERKAVEERLRSLSHSLVEMQEQERRHIARELHDGMAQSLASARILLDRINKSSIDDAKPMINEARDVVQDVIDQVREMSLNLRPSMLDDLGLLPALNWHFKQITSRTGIKINFRHSGLKAEISKEARTAAYRIIQEALGNAVRYSGADQIDVTVRIKNNVLSLVVEDHGKGFDMSSMPAMSSGLSTMHERAYLCSGSLTIDSNPGLGTRVSAKIPVLSKEGR